MISRIVALTAMVLTLSRVSAASPTVPAATEQDATALYCMQVHRLSLVQLERVYAGIPGSADSPNARVQLSQHKARLENVERYVRPRIEKMDRAYVDKVMAMANTDFQKAAEDTNTCIRSCPDDRCRALCITRPSPATRRVDSCLHRSW